MLCDCECLAAEFETVYAERLSQERIPIQIQQTARRSIQCAGLSVEEKLPVFVSVDRGDIMPRCSTSPWEMEEEVVAVGKELRPTVRLLRGRSCRY